MRWEVQSALIGAAGIVLSAGVSATAVIITQQLAEGRSERERQRVRESEDARRRDERALESDRREAATNAEKANHQRSLEERWRDERRNAHARLLSALDAYWAPISRFMSAFYSGTAPDYATKNTLPAASDEVRTELQEALSVVELIGSLPAVEAARKAANTARMTGYMAQIGSYEVSSYRTRGDEYRQALDAYRAAARRELGVEGSEASAAQ